MTYSDTAYAFGSLALGSRVAVAALHWHLGDTHGCERNQTEPSGVSKVKQHGLWHGSITQCDIGERRTPIWICESGIRVFENGRTSDETPKSESKQKPDAHRGFPRVRYRTTRLRRRSVNSSRIRIHVSKPVTFSWSK